MDSEGNEIYIYLKKIIWNITSSFNTMFWIVKCTLYERKK